MRREINSNHRLIITPDLRDILPSGNHDATRALLGEMADQIHRHVDHVYSVTVQWDTTKSVCSHCGYEWEVVTAEDLANYPDDYEGQALGEPVCCDQAATEFRAEQGQALGQTGGA